MNILILGGTGRVGSHLVKHALADRHQVTMLVRDQKRGFEKEKVTIFQGNVLVREDVFQAIKGMDTVMCALNTDGQATLSESMPIIMEAMVKEGVSRIITIGTAGILQSRVTPSLLRYKSSESRRKSVFAAQEHQKVYELLRQSSLDWTIVCPTYLPDGERVGTYRVERDFLPEGGLSISVADTADFAYSLIEDPTFSRSRVGIAY